MRTIVIELAPCCGLFSGMKKQIGSISDMLGTDKVRIAVSSVGIIFWYCPFCGKEINLRVKE